MPLRIALIVEPNQTRTTWLRRLVEEIGLSDGVQLLHIFVCDTVPKHRSVFRTLSRYWWKFETRFAGGSGATSTPWPGNLQPLEALDLSSAASNNVCGDADLVLDLTHNPETSKRLGPEIRSVWYLDFLKSPAYAFALRTLASDAAGVVISLKNHDASNSTDVTVATAFLDRKPAATRLQLLMLEKCVPLMIRSLRRLAAGIEEKPPIDTPLAPMNSIPLHLALRYAVFFCYQLMSRALTAIAKKLGMRPGAFHLRSGTLAPIGFSPKDLTRHNNPKGHYFADPFFWRQGERTFIFFEDYEYKTLTGRIAVGELVNGELIDIQRVIESDYHMSFPFVFEHKDRLLMLPETSNVNRIELWECVEFPHRWKQASVLIDDIKASDSVIQEIDGAVWLITNVSHDSMGEMSSELHLFRLVGDAWETVIPHKFNPVVLDARTARNGGRVLEIDGALFRVSQNNSHGKYGYGLNLMRIDSISDEEYSETRVHAITPAKGDGFIGCHHMDAIDNKIVTDVRLSWDLKK